MGSVMIMVMKPGIVVSDPGFFALVRWRQTARVLRKVADSYQRDAHHHDSEAERMSDDG